MVVVWACCGLLARLLRRLVQLPALLCCEAMVWSITLLAFPIRMLTAMERERKMGRVVAAMQEQMDGLVWENKDLEERLRAALKEQGAMEALLDEMEEEREDALARIDVLEDQLKALKEENLRLIEHKGKAKWDNKAKAGEDHANKLVNKKISRGPEEQDDAFKFAALTTAASSEDDALLVALHAKAVARRRSLFSLGMSLAVGAVAWSADAPCLPLLAGLFAVVGLSMLSVSRSRRGADAVALLSLNWFLLGVLTSPMLPGVARALVPRAGRVLGPALTWFVAMSPL